MSTTLAEKAVLRKHGLARRRALSDSEWARRSKDVVVQLGTVVAFRVAPLVLTYVANRDKEVDTRPLIESLLRAGRRVGAPVTTERGIIVWREIHDLSDLQVGRFNILEPPERGEPIDTFSAATVVLAPGILFTAKGTRIGYGGGYFDRFLSDFPGVSIGLAFDFQLYASLPTEPRDRPVDFVVCESGVHDRRVAG